MTNSKKIYSRLISSNAKYLTMRSHHHHHHRHIAYEEDNFPSLMPAERTCIPLWGGHPSSKRHHTPPPADLLAADAALGLLLSC